MLIIYNSAQLIFENSLENLLTWSERNIWSQGVETKENESEKKTKDFSLYIGKNWEGKLENNKLHALEDSNKIVDNFWLSFYLKY